MTEQKQTLPTYIIIAITFILFLSIILHANYMNGPWYWKWPWQRIDCFKIMMSVIILGMPFFVVQFMQHRKQLSPSVTLLWMMVAMFLGQIILCSIQDPEGGLLRIVKIIEDPVTTSYFTDALRISNIHEFLKDFPSLLPSMHLHAITKPPGLILFYWLMLSWFPSAHLSALAGGLFLAVLSTIIIPATFFMTKAITQNKEAAFNAASLITLMPSLILFFPEFDQVFPIFTCVLLGLWAYVLRNNKLSDSFLFGIALSVTLFFTWSVLVTGAFLVMLTVYQSVKNKGQAPLRIKEHLIMSFGVLAAFYFILWKITGFNVFDTFLQCLALEGELIIDRPYPYTIFYGFTDFLLGAGWIPLILGGIFIWGKRQSKDQSFWVSIFCYSQVLLVAVLNFFPAETARVEMFLLPIFIIPAAFALLNVSFKDKMIVHGCQIVLLGVIAQNMRFIN